MLGLNIHWGFAFISGSASTHTTVGLLLHVRTQCPQVSFQFIIFLYQHVGHQSRFHAQCEITVHAWHMLSLSHV